MPLPPLFPQPPHPQHHHSHRTLPRETSLCHRSPLLLANSVLHYSYPLVQVRVKNDLMLLDPDAGQVLRQIRLMLCPQEKLLSHPQMLVTIVAMPTVVVAVPQLTSVPRAAMSILQLVLRIVPQVSEYQMHQVVDSLSVSVHTRQMGANSHCHSLVVTSWSRREKACV